jgi:hypothetical protein
VQVIIDDRALDRRAIEMLAAVLVRPDSSNGANGRGARRVQRRKDVTRVSR